MSDPESRRKRLCQRAQQPSWLAVDPTLWSVVLAFLGEPASLHTASKVCKLWASVLQKRHFWQSLREVLELDLRLRSHCRFLSSAAGRAFLAAGGFCCSLALRADTKTSTPSNDLLSQLRPQRLRASGNYLTRDKLRALLGGNQSLSVVCIQRGQLDDEILSQLPASVHTLELRRSGGACTGDKVSRLPTSLRRLALRRCGAVGLSGFTRLLQLAPGLLHLELEQTIHDNRSWLAQIKKLAGLQGLRLRHLQSVTHNALNQLCSALPELEELELSHCGPPLLVSPINLNALPKLSRLKYRDLDYLTYPHGLPAGLTHLELVNVGSLDDSWLHSLSQLSSLQELHLGNCRSFTDAGLARLRPAAMHTLVLTDCRQLTVRGLGDLARNLPGLHTVAILGCNLLTDDGLRLAVRRWQRLCSFGLELQSGCAGAWLAELPSGLRRLQLLNVSIHDYTLKSLARLTRLCELRLELCQEVTDEGLVHLEQLANLRSLKLGMARQVTTVGVERLAQALELHHLRVWCK